MGQWNTEAFVWMAGGFHPNRQLLFMAVLAASWGASLAAAVMALAASRQPADRLYLFGTVVACAFAAVLAHALAKSFSVPRPFVLGLSPPYLSHGDRGSFPSAHAAVMFTAAFILSARHSLRMFALVMAIISGMTAWGRIYTGLHFPFDILGGAFLALCISSAFSVARSVAIAAIAVPGRAVLAKRKA
jgi:undecaprenyl-diphosphatase